MAKYSCREDVPEKYKWDLSDFFKSVDEFETVFEETNNLIKDLISYKGCTKDAKRLKEFLDKETLAVSNWENLYVYAYLINDQVLGISENIERRNRCENLNMLLTNNISFFAPELLELDHDEYNNLFIENSELEEYASDLERIYRDKEHTLSEREENIISSLTNAVDHFENASATILNKEHNYGRVTMPDGTEEELTTTNYRRIQKNMDEEGRKKTYEQLFSLQNNYGTTCANFLDSYVKMNNTIAQLHHFDSAWEAKLFHANMPDEAYKCLVDTVYNNIEPLQDYFKLKKEALGLEELHQYDLPLEMAKTDYVYTVEEAQKTVREAIKPLGDEYLKCFDKIVDNRYVDYAQYKGKCSGGYSFSTLTHDSRILMSFNDDLDSVSTLAHEAGHNVHHQMVTLNNKIQYRNVTSLVSEVASLTNECLLSNYLVNNSDDKSVKLAGLANIMDVIVSNLYGAVREGKMEQDMYEHVLTFGTLTKDFLDDLSLKSLNEFYGDTVVLGQYANCGWITRSHYYMNFYLYSYAICISVATYVAKHIIEGDEELLANYLKFLKTGSDVWPIDAFKILGVDLKNKDVYQECIQYFSGLIDEYRNIMNNG